MKKKLTVFLLTLCMLFGMFSVCAYATDIGNIPAKDPQSTVSPTSSVLPSSDPNDKSITKVLIQMNTSKPVVFGKVSTCAVTVSTEGCTVTNVAWFDPDGTPVAGDTFEKHGNYKLELTVTALGGYAFTNSTAVYINNARAACSIGVDVIKVTATIQSVYWAPVINVQPDTRKHTLTEGDCLTLMAAASYYDKTTWKVIASDKKIYTLEKAAEKFPGLTVIGADTATLQLNNIPLTMSGCRIYCTFSNDAASTDTQGVPLVVNKDPNKVEPTPTPTPEPSVTPDASPAPAEGDGQATESPASDPADDPAHTHSFLDSWTTDAESHWHECACGAISGLEAHSFTWTTVKGATKNEEGEEAGECSVCGYITNRAIEKKTSSGSKLGFILPLILVIIVVAAGGYYMSVKGAASYAGGKHSKQGKH